MRRIHVLTAGFASPNGRAFLMPLVVHKYALADAGISVRLFDAPGDNLLDCDVLMFDSKYFGSRWSDRSQEVLAEISSYSEKVAATIYVDLQDSAGWEQARALPLVTLYCKSQILRDRSRYLEPLYGYRIFSDYYHREMGVDDDPPVVSEPVKEARDLDKLTLLWNSGLADYSWAGPARMAAYGFSPLPGLLKFPTRIEDPANQRDLDVSCRMGTNYIRKSVSYQRQRLSQILAPHMGTGKLSRRAYISELRNSRIVVSPFGYGEITLRDFEIFLNGAAMLKADMSDIETWPDFYADGQTMMAYKWDLSDVEEKIDTLLSDNSARIEIAAEGQARYMKHVSSPEAGAIFAAHMSQILDKADSHAKRHSA